MSAGFQDHFSALAQKYASYRPHYPRALFEYLASISAGRRLAWDCACGNGQASLDLAEYFDEVAATDASGEQIAAAKQHPKIQYSAAPAEASKLPAACADLITVAQALHWFDLEQFYPEARRVLKPGAHIAVWCYGICLFDSPVIDELFVDFYANAVGPYWPPEREHVEAGYRDLPFPFNEIQTPPFNMATRWTMAELIGYLSTWSAVKRYTEANKASPLPQFEAQLLTVWGDPGIARQIAWPLALRVGSA